MNTLPYRILIVEDTKERQEIMKDLFRDHAWIMVHTVSRAIRLLSVYEFDIVSLDYDLAGPRKGDEIAAFISNTVKKHPKIIIHSDNVNGVVKMKRWLPHADAVPVSKMISKNIYFKRIRDQLKKSPDVDWALVFAK